MHRNARTTNTTPMAAWISVQWVLDDIRVTLLDTNPPRAGSPPVSKLRELVTATSWRADWKPSGGTETRFRSTHCEG